MSCPCVFLHHLEQRYYRLTGEAVSFTDVEGDLQQAQLQEAPLCCDEVGEKKREKKKISSNFF
jgi:hypothetical protein